MLDFRNKSELEQELEIENELKQEMKPSHPKKKSKSLNRLQHMRKKKLSSMAGKALPTIPYTSPDDTYNSLGPGAYNPKLESI